ncbi:unnamed protein product [Notodromas monacha]|uniref:Uncharacterized protein n=1 Tax=Notodromas monacha TaxID=399045 RepID=A0A7R9GLG0_9CRUS|nr:unnamed protein product [Notodromas monacha]CAG0925858.1 unnamed protein product [Notodromas monacha]
MDEEDKPRNPFAKHFGRLKSSDDIYAAVVQNEGSQDATVSDQLRSLISAKPSPAVLSGGSIIVSDRQEEIPF